MMLLVFVLGLSLGALTVIAWALFGAPDVY